MKLNRILYPTDYSACSKVAFEYAVKLAHYFKVPLHILHVYNNVTLMSRNAEELSEAAEKGHITQQQKMKDFLDEYYLHATALPLKEIEINTHLLVGNVVDSTLKYATETESSIIVLGTKGEQENTFNLGSIAASVTAKSEIPVLAIPEDNHFKPFKQLVFADDYEAVDKTELDYLIEISEMNNAKLTVLHIREVKDYEHQYRTNSFDRLKKMYADNENVVFQFIDGGYRKLDSISDYVKENEVDILALKKRNTDVSAKETLVYQLVSKSVVPCLVY